MKRPFAMVNTGIHYDARFRPMSESGRYTYLTILTHERIDLTGAGLLSVRILADCLVKEPSQCKTSLEECEIQGLIGYDQDYGVIYLRNWWTHTTLTPRGLEVIISSLKSGEYGRSMGSNEYWALCELIDELEDPFSKKSSMIKPTVRSLAKALVQERLSEINEPRKPEKEGLPAHNNEPNFNGFENHPDDVMEA